MSDIVLFFLLVIVLIVLIISLVYASRASIALQSAPDNADLISAQSYLAWTVATIWLVLIGIIIGTVALVIFGPEFIPTFGSTLVYLVLFVFVIAIITIGVNASIAASEINRSGINTPDINNAYDNAVIAAVTALGSIGVTIIIYYFVWHSSKVTPSPDTPETSNPEYQPEYQPQYPSEYQPEYPPQYQPEYQPEYPPQYS
jgi:hypothetical protein